MKYFIDGGGGGKQTISKKKTFELMCDEGGG